MSTRLNKQNRKEFLAKLEAVAFTDKLKADTEARDKMYMVLFEDYHRTVKHLMEHLPETFMRLHTNSIQVLVKGRDAIRLNPPVGGIRGADDFSQPQYERNRYSLDGLCERHTTAVANKLRKVIAASDALREEVTTFRTDAMVLMNSVTTTKRLYEIWPELKEFPALVISETPKSQQLAPNTAELTRVLRLGKKK